MDIVEWVVCYATRKRTFGIDEEEIGVAFGTRLKDQRRPIG